VAERPADRQKVQAGASTVSSTGATGATGVDPARTLTNWKRNFALFITAQGLTLFGSMLVYYAVMWHIMLETQSGLMMTLIVVAGVVPMFLISPFGGVWADRYSKKILINVADTSIAVVTLGMAILFSVGIEDMTVWLLLCLAARGLGQGVQMPAVNALVPVLVPKEHLTRANGISGTMQAIIMFASPVAGGVVLAFLPIQTLLFIDVVTAIIGITVLWFLVTVPKHGGAKDSPPGFRQYFVEIGEGLTYIRTSAFLWKMLLLSAFFNFMAAPAASLTPLQVTRNWGDGIMYLFGTIALGAEQRLAGSEALYFLGMVVGGAAVAIWGGYRNKSHTLALSTFAFGIGAAGLGLLGNFYLYLICMAFVGIFMGIFNAPSMAILQTNVKQDYMGRVFSVMMMISTIMMPIGMALWGPLSDVVSIDTVFIWTGVVIFLIGFAFVFDKDFLRAGISEGTAEDAGDADASE